MMTHHTAASVIPLLQQSLSNVLEGAWTVAAVSMMEFETYSDLLAPARLGIYSVLTAIYAEHPDLDSLAGKSLGEAEATGPEGGTDPKPHTGDRPLDGETLERVAVILEAACGLIGQAEAEIRGAPGIDTGQCERFKGLCQEASRAVRLTTDHLAAQRATL
jgi:hypothetical protein